MRALSLLGPTIATIYVCLLWGCETSNYAPSVTPQMARSTSSELPKLERGRTLFVHRCIECHTLPTIWRYSREDWPEIVNNMSHRASLKPAECDAVIAYILAVRATER
ncbi:MAG TPA: hypothetical protein VEP30_13100 [Chthoniobacterales bacterium]|nr:hypothetical protein [Chthoniobacterales bacterium]